MSNPAAEKITHMTAQGQRPESAVVRALRELEAIEWRQGGTVDEARSLLFDYLDAIPSKRRRALEGHFGEGRIPSRR